MKKLILLAVFAATTGICSAQISFGFQAGPNFAMGKLKYDNAYFSPYVATQKNKVKVGFIAGFVAEIPIGSMLAFRPELNFIQQGTKQSVVVTNGFDTYAAEQKINLNYVQLPLNVIYKLPVGGGSVFFGLGPALAVGISGKNKFTSSTDPANNEDRDVKFDGKKSEGQTSSEYFDKDHLKRVDVGINVIAGYKLAMGVFAKLGYSHGFIDASVDKSDPDPDDRYTFKNSGFNLTFGYMFGGSKSKK